MLPPPCPPPACESIISELKDMHLELDALQEELQRASSVSEKQKITSEIKILSAQIATKEKELAVCVKNNQLPAAPNAANLVFTGATTNGAAGLMQVSWSASGTLQNLKSSPVHLDIAQSLLATRGGWVFDMGDLMQTPNKFFGLGPNIAPSATIAVNMGNTSNNIFTPPITNVLFRLLATDAGGNVQDQFFQFPVVVPGSAVPASLETQLPIMIALQEPIEVISLAGEEELTLLLIGQLINGTGKPVTLTQWNLTITSERGEITVAADLTSTFAVVNNAAAVIPFLRKTPMPNTFSQGTLALKAGVIVDGVCRPVSRQASISKISNEIFHAPVTGRWLWNNGPGQIPFGNSAHHGFPEQRYAYDISIQKPVKGTIATFDGDPFRNTSFFCWDQPILAMEDGQVDDVVDNIPDNFGKQANSANPNRDNSRIFLRHSGDRFSIYAHIKQGSAKVQPGDPVSRGQEIARVGNAGNTSEPHLHFECRIFDPTGRARPLPMAFRNLADVNGQAVSRVPVGGIEYDAKN